MNNEAFWIRLENEVLPHVEEEHLREFREHLDKLKNVDIFQDPRLTQHQWLSLGCFLRDLHCYQGLNIKTLVEHCSVSAGFEPTKIVIFDE